jgi:FkbM family methyltransferase
MYNGRLAIGIEAKSSVDDNRAAWKGEKRMDLERAARGSTFLWRARPNEWKRLVREVALGSLPDAFESYEDEGSHDAAEELLDLRVRGVDAPIRLRRKTSDFDVFRQIFLCRQYALRPAGPVEYIFDAGANIGLASVYLLRRFPHARVIAVEPDSENIELAKHNLQTLSARCRLVHGAVWSARGALGIRRGNFGDGRHWATETVPLGGSTAIADTVPAFTIEQLMRRHRFPRIDVLKMDIEGAELPIFRDGDLAFLERTACCVVECHSEEGEEAFRSAVGRFDFSVTQRGEALIATK